MPGSRWKRWLLPVAVLAAGGIAAWLLLQTRPQAARKPAPRLARLVETTIAARGAHTVVIEALGTVVPSRRVDVKPLVAGAVVETSPELVPGGRFRAGELLVVVDPRDYELAVRQREAELAEAEAQMALEMGNQEVARRESEILGELVSEGRLDLVLRKPQLDTARARVAVARAALDAAKLDLARTRVEAPFDSIVEAREVVVGSRIDENTTVATLVGADEYWIEVTVPARDLRWLDFAAGTDREGARARIVDESAWARGAERWGRAVRRLVDLESEGRLARLLVSVTDPLALDEPDRPALLLGSVVRVDLYGTEIEGVVLDRALLRDGDDVWVMTADDTLAIRPVQVEYRGRETVVVRDGLTGGERLVASELSTPVEGMPLRSDGADRDG